MKGGDFNTTEDQFVRVLFEEYSATQDDKSPGKEVSEDQCKLNFPKVNMCTQVIAIMHLFGLIIIWIECCYTFRLLFG